MADLTPITMPARLIELRDQVLARSTKRMPKWKFRLAPDIVMMLQPKPEANLNVWDGEFGVPGRRRVPVSLRFAGEVLMQDGADAKALSATKKDRRDFDPHIRLKFEIVTRGDDASTGWEWWLSRNGRSGKLGPEWSPKSAFGDGVSGDKRMQEFDRLENLVDRVLVDAFEDGTFDVVDAKLMLMTQCLVCGKALTDPASMARYIGPECAGTASVHVPRMQKLTKPCGSDTTAAPVYEPAPVPRRERKPEPVEDLFESEGEPNQDDGTSTVSGKNINAAAVAIIKAMGEQIKLYDRETVILGLALVMSEGPEDEDELEEMLGYVRGYYEQRAEDELEDA